MGSAPAATPRAAEICCTCICAPRWSNRDDESIPLNSWTGDSPTRVGYEAANGAAMNIATMKTNNASIRDVRRYDESIFRMMRVEGT